MVAPAREIHFLVALGCACFCTVSAPFQPRRAKPNRAVFVGSSVGGSNLRAFRSLCPEVNFGVLYRRKYKATPIKRAAKLDKGGVRTKKKRDGQKRKKEKEKNNFQGRRSVDRSIDSARVIHCAIQT